MENNYKTFLNALKLERIENKESKDGLIKIAGYACHYGNANHNGEIVDENSFKKFFSDLESGGMMPMFNYQHDDTKIIGGWDKFDSRDDGLYAEGHLNTNSSFVKNEILPLVEAGDVTHLSTQGFCNYSDIDIKEDNYCYIKNFILTGVSLVALPADFSAKADLTNKLSLVRKGKQEIENTIDLSLIY